jgi:hypothetical protein
MLAVLIVFCSFGYICNLQQLLLCSFWFITTDPKVDHSQMGDSIWSYMLIVLKMLVDGFNSARFLLF